MKIEVIEIKDLEGGGAEVIIDFDDEAKRFLINEGVISALEKGIARVKALHEKEVVEKSTYDFSTLSTRVQNCMEAEGISTVDQVKELIVSGRIKYVINLGDKGASELMQWYIRGNQ